VTKGVRFDCTHLIRRRRAAEVRKVFATRHKDRAWPAISAAWSLAFTVYAKRTGRAATAAAGCLAALAGARSPATGIPLAAFAGAALPVGSAGNPANPADGGFDGVRPEPGANSDRGGNRVQEAPPGTGSGFRQTVE
jgi:hypothetical protein